jgi:hypothetical protein
VVWGCASHCVTIAVFFRWPLQCPGLPVPVFLQIPWQLLCQVILNLLTCMLSIVSAVFLLSMKARVTWVSWSNSRSKYWVLSRLLLSTSRGILRTVLDPARTPGLHTCLYQGHGFSNLLKRWASLAPFLSISRSHIELQHIMGWRHGSSGRALD